MLPSNLGQMSVLKRGGGEKGIGSSPPRREASSRKVSLINSDQTSDSSNLLTRLLFTVELTKLHTTSYAMLGNLHQFPKLELGNLFPCYQQM
jgi:hypothetical protein